MAIKLIEKYEFDIESWHSKEWLNILHIYILVTQTGGRLNKKDGLTRYGNSHVKDKTS